MGNVKPSPVSVKLFMGMLSGEESLFDELRYGLERDFGHVDLESDVWKWGHTDYYLKEMGSGLKRQFIFFKKLINPESITEVKLKTIEIERQYLNENNNPPVPPFAKRGMGGFKGGRRINLDPGYLDSSKVVLVSTKNYSHRIYLCNGIYGEVTLTYSGGDFQALPYTYPDFRAREYLDVFKNARELYRGEIKNP